MSDGSDDASRASYDSYMDPLRRKEYSSPETNSQSNSWESFLVGKEVVSPSKKETSISYLDQFETASNDGDLLSSRFVMKHVE